MERPTGIGVSGCASQQGERGSRPEPRLSHELSARSRGIGLGRGALPGRRELSGDSALSC